MKSTKNAIKRSLDCVRRISQTESFNRTQCRETLSPGLFPWWYHCHFISFISLWLALSLRSIFRRLVRALKFQTNPLRGVEVRSIALLLLEPNKPSYQIWSPKALTKSNTRLHVLSIVIKLMALWLSLAARWSLFLWYFGSA